MLYLLEGALTEAAKCGLTPLVGLPVESSIAGLFSSQELNFKVLMGEPMAGLHSLGETAGSQKGYRVDRSSARMWMRAALRWADEDRLHF